jgi:hypothetical protein
MKVRAIDPYVIDPYVDAGALLLRAMLRQVAA